MNGMRPRLYTDDIWSILAYSASEEWSIAVLKTYFDGSGAEHDPNEKAIVLAGYVADCETWSAFENDWAEVLRQHDAPPWHSTDAMLLRGDFTHWDDARVDALLVNLIQVADSCKELFGCACAVLLDDHADVSRKRRILSPSHLCADFCVSAVQWYRPQETDFQMFFDWNEPFLKHIDKQWRNRRSRKSRPYLEKIKMLAAIQPPKPHALQCADMLAWRVAARWRGKLVSRPFGRLLSAPIQSCLWDRDTLLAKPWAAKPVCELTGTPAQYYSGKPV